MARLPITYYIDWSGLEDFDYDFDDAGLPRYDYGGDIGLKYNPITISQWGLFQLGEWERSGDESCKAQAFRCADWLVENAHPWKQDIVGWIYDYGFDLYGPYPPWISGMAQGEAISLLLRCHQLHPQEKYENSARGAVKAFDYFFDDGGVTAALADGSIFFQEYPTSPAVHVLNGGIFALLGVYDYACFFDDEHYSTLAYQAVDTLKNHWRDWDAACWTFYDLFPVRRYVSTMYQELHIRQFKVLADVFDCEEFKLVSKRWRRMQKNLFCRFCWFIHKLYEKIRLRRIMK